MENPMFFRNRRLIAAAIAATAACVSTSALAQSMIVRSSGPSAAKYPVGKKLAANEKITLVSGDRVVLLDKGKTRTLARPGVHNSSATVAANQTLSTTMSQMISRDGALRRRGGATRGPGDAEMAVADIRAPNLWLIDARKGGNFCVADPGALLFWRPDINGDTSLRVEAEGSAAKAETIAFLDGQAYRRWPGATLPLTAGSSYRLSGGGMDKPVSIRFQLLDSLPETPDDIAAKLLERGCTAQLDRLVDTMAEDEGMAG
ncbi:MAG: hypothetical protein H2056_03530 [Sphingopyxis sp.]|nr:hypothetical protein [Sphingopyxis sp.]